MADPTPPVEDQREKEAEEYHISLGSKSKGDSKDGGTESCNSQVTPVKVTLGRKTKKKQREEKTYLDILQGSQKTLKGMINTRSTIKQGQAPKGATTSQASK